MQQHRLDHMHTSLIQGTTRFPVIDTQTNTVIATVPLGNSPYGVAVNPDGIRIYVTNSYFGNNGTVSVIDASTNTVITNVPLENYHSTYGVAVNPAGTRIYVATGNNTTSVIDAATNTVIAIVPVGFGPSGIAVSPDGSRIYVIVVIAPVPSIIILIMARFLSLMQQRIR